MVDNQDNHDFERLIRCRFNGDFSENIEKYIKDKNVIHYYHNCIMLPDLYDAEEFVTKALKQDSKFIPYADKMIDKALDMLIFDKALEPDFEMRVSVLYKNYHNDKMEILNNQLNLLQKYFDKDKLTFYFSTRETDYYDKESMQNIVKLCEEYPRSSVGYWGGFSPVDRFLEANQKADMLVEHIKSLGLSPFEQFLLVHDFVAGKPYKDDEKLFHSPSPEEFNCRKFVDCMTGDKIVCVGYAMIMERLCDKLGIQCDYVHGKAQEQDKTSGVTRLVENGHAFNMVHLVDPKYGIDGCYLCDSCWDSELSQRGVRNYFYSAMPLQDIQYDSHSRYFNEDMNIKDYGDNIVKYPDYSTPIPLETFETALSTAYNKMNDSEYDEYFNKEFITRSLKMTVSHGNSIFDKQAENCFTQKDLER